MVREALRAGTVVACFVGSEATGAATAVASEAEEAGVRVHATTPSALRPLTGTINTQGIVAVCRFVDVPLRSLGSPSLVAVLLEGRDPGNLGSIVRSADAAGASAVVLTEGCVDVYNEKAVRASAGSLFHLPIVRGVAVEDVVEGLRSLGLVVLAASADGELSVFEADRTRPSAILFGNEARGLPARIRSASDGTMRVPIHPRAESLNLAAAAAVVLFEVSRRREEEPPGR